MTNKESSPVSELVERLRSAVGYSPYIGYALVSEAADRLTALEAENARLREALVDIAEDDSSDIEGVRFFAQNVISVLEATPPVPKGTGGEWRYEIKYGPEGEANYAFVYDDSGHLVSNLKVHHAKAVVAAMNATLSSDAVAGGEEVVSAWQFKHFDPISGHPVWKSTLYWNGHRSTEGRPLYASPPKLDQLRDRVKELEKALDGMLVPFEGDDPCRKDHHGYCQSHFLEEDCCVAIARRVREGGKV